MCHHRVLGSLLILDTENGDLMIIKHVKLAHKAHCITRLEFAISSNYNVNCII